MSNTEGLSTFRQALQLPSSRCVLEPYIDLATDGDCDVKDLIGEAEERGAIQLGASAWLRRRGEERNLTVMLPEVLFRRQT